MLMPKRVKRRKQFRGRMKGVATRGNTITYGDYGIVAMEPSWITSNQIESARIALTRHIKRGGQVWIKIFPDKPVTEKPAETRMGSGKGSPEYWVAVVKPGRVMFELGGVTDDEVAREALRLAINKLPIKCKIIMREGGPRELSAAMKAKIEHDAFNAEMAAKSEADEAGEPAAVAPKPAAEHETDGEGSEN